MNSREEQIHKNDLFYATYKYEKGSTIIKFKTIKGMFINSFRIQCILNEDDINEFIYDVESNIREQILNYING